ncbi:hypothetical protein H6789_02665 [Candidatus Nomurabacteria bacterium]|nr:hypothetical protein [Candidatus Kaiserbacteria bacterium]MCB9815357.1 hypothetical protein [Candidatus Nomurabacteria bacterium]MCB9819579.1 hypothetical protein [Candidatus Nomurabacteria bacterium]
MGFFDSTPKRVTKEEMKEIMSNLYGKLDEEERIEVEKLFRADLNEPGIEYGISQLEFDAAMAWLEANPSKHKLEADDIENIKKYFAEHLKD